MKILFLDQSGKPGGAELCLLDIAKPYRDRCLVTLLADGPFRALLEQHEVPVQVLTQQSIQVQKDSSVWQGLFSLQRLIAPLMKIIELSKEFDLIYANTQKALVVGAIASLFSRRPLVYHLHDIVSLQHFSRSNQRVIVTLANQCAVLVIANSQASQAAFTQAGGNAAKTTVIYNGFAPQHYLNAHQQRELLRRELNLSDRFVIGHFSRLSPWKGQHILMEALNQCSENVVALFVGDALFGEDDYVQQLHQQVQTLGLSDRVQFLGFRSDIPALMAACDLITHTSTEAEPFGRVIVEAMLCGTPVIASEDGGAIELVEHGQTGWLVPPAQPTQLAQQIQACQADPDQTMAIAQQAQQVASHRFCIDQINQQTHQVLLNVLGR
ncbi:MAG: glycosyltransferase [Leptolyngbyaceae cyanobacterium bins.349]|nr:glycosyltransferase [Leptolyngbyaceae cyanobacterium bins.349]